MKAAGNNSRRRTWRCVKATALVMSLVFSALLMAVGIGLPGASWLAWISLLPLFWAIRALSPIRAAWSGAVWGMCLYAFCAHGAAGPISTGLLALALLTLIPAAYAGLGSLLTRAIGFNPVVMAFAWILVEVALHPLGLREGLLGGTQSEGASVHWLSRMFGYVFVAFLVACANASLLAVLSRAHLKVSWARLLARSSDSGASPASQIFFSVQLLALRQGYPRAPPTQVSRTG